MPKILSPTPPTVSDLLRSAGEAGRAAYSRRPIGRPSERGPESVLERRDGTLMGETTTRDEAEMRLAMEDRMIAVFGHDLRGLLNALTLNAELFLRREGEAAAESARVVRLTIGRMDQLVASLLDSVRVRADKLNVVPRPVDAADILRETVEIFLPLAHAKDLALTLVIPKTPLRTRIDPERIAQVLSNLLSNAIKFSPVSGEICIQAATSGPDFQVSVRDDGPGIPERDLDRIFEGLCQLQESDSRGLGLGLYISRAIIQAHGGRIWAASRPGTGSTFHFTIPGLPSQRALSRSPRRSAFAAMA